MADGTFMKGLLYTSPVIAAALISVVFGVNLAMNPTTEANYIPPTTEPTPTQTTPPPSTTVPPTGTNTPTTPTTPTPTIPVGSGEF